MYVLCSHYFRSLHTPPLSYKDSGVDIAAGNTLVQAIKPMAASSNRYGLSKLKIIPSTKFEFCCCKCYTYFAHRNDALN